MLRRDCTSDRVDMIRSRFTLDDIHDIIHPLLEGQTISLHDHPFLVKCHVSEKHMRMDEDFQMRRVT